MKLILLILLMPFIGFAQTKKKQFVWPKPVKDSTWMEMKCDTIFGEMEVPVGFGKIVSKGFVTTCRIWRYNKNVYTPRGQHLIDSFYRTQRDSSWGLLDMISGYADPSFKTAYIITSSGKKEIEGEFTFKPY